MRIFLAGATGVLGQRITPALIDAGHEVVALTRSAERGEQLAALGAEPVTGDIFDPATVSALLQTARPDAVMHQLTDLSERSSAANARIRIEGTRNLVDAAVAAGVERIIVQSIAWCYGPGLHPAAEGEPPDLVSPDAARRATVDAVVTMETEARRIPEAVILRNGLLYGDGTWYAPDGAMADAARAGRLSVSADVASFVHVDDAARAAVQALEWPGGAVNIVDSDPAAGSEWAPVFAASVGAPAPDADTQPRTPWARGADNTLALSLGWAPNFPTWRAGFPGYGIA